jgi:hypothetical protein
MPTIVEIPNIGEVEFPDGMTDADISAAAHKLSNPQPWYSGSGAFMDAYRQNAEIAKADPNSLTGQVMRRNEAADKPMIPLPRAPQAESTIGQVASGIYNGAIAPAVETMTSPNAIRTLPVAAAGRLASAVLAPVMGANAVQQGAEAINQAGNPDATLQQVVEPAAGAVSSALMAAGAGRHATSKPQLPQNNVIGENRPAAPILEQVNQEATGSIQTVNRPIQDVQRLSNMRGERGAGDIGLPPHEPQGEGIESQPERPIGNRESFAGTPQMRDPVRELPQETPRGETEATKQPTSRTIETVGEGQLFRNDEISFNLVGETDASAAEAAAAAEIKASQEAAAAQDAAQAKMFEEPPSPPLESSAGEKNLQGAPAAIETPAASPTAEPEAAVKPAGNPNPLLDALNADMQTARAAGDKDKVKELANLRVNYLLRRPPAIKKVEKSYGEQSAQPTLPAGKVKGDKPMTKTQLFSEQPVARWVIENGGIMSATEARRVKGKDWWESTGKGMYEALGRIPPAYGKIIFRRGSKSTPDELMGAVGLRNADNQIEGSPFGPTDTHHELLARLMDEVESAKGGKSARGVTSGIKSHEQHMNEQAAIHEQQAESKGLHLPVDEMTPGDTLRLPSSSGGGVAKVVDVDADGNVTIEMPKGVTITMPSGNSLKVSEHIRSEERSAGADEPF